MNFLGNKQNMRGKGEDTGREFNHLYKNFPVFLVHATFKAYKIIKKNNCKAGFTSVMMPHPLPYTCHLKSQNRLLSNSVKCHQCEESQMFWSIFQSPVMRCARFFQVLIQVALFYPLRFLNQD